MSCTQSLSGITGDCTTNIGGNLATLYIANFADVVETVADGVVSGLTGTFYAYDLKKNTTSISATWTIDDAVRFCQTDVVGALPKMDTAKRLELEALVQADLYIVVEDANGKKWAIGSTEGARVSAMSGVTGAAKTDANQYDFTFTSYDDHFPYEVTATVSTSSSGS